MSTCVLCGVELKFFNTARGGITHPSDGGELCIVCFTEANESLEKKGTLNRHTLDEIKQLIRGDEKQITADTVKSYLSVHGIVGYISAGDYLSGFSTCTAPCAPVYVGFSSSEAMCFKVIKSKAVIEVGRMALASIKDVSLDDATTIENKVTLGRVLALGVFALAFKKKVKTEQYYVTVTYSGKQIDTQLVFQFDGNNSKTTASKLHQAFISNVNK